VGLETLRTNRQNSGKSDRQGMPTRALTMILISLPIAGCTLAAGIAAGLADRKRPFSLLRLTGARLATLRQVVALEGAIPLLAVAAVAIGVGFAGAAMFATMSQNRPMVAQGPGYYLLTAGGLIVSLGIIAATFPLARWTPYLESELCGLRTLVRPGSVCIDVGSAADLYTTVLSQAART
jgi:hypothetical protein